MELYWIVWNIFGAMGVGVFPILLILPAPYGKFTRKGWGPVLNGKLFWIIQESPCLFISSYYLYNAENPDLESFICLLMLFVHYFRRSLMYGILMSPASKTTAPVVFSAIFFNIANGYLQAAGLMIYDNAQTNYFQARFWVGMFVWLFGYITNSICDEKIRSLRKPGENSYKIPYGGFFEFVSSANYFTESIEWLGWGIICGNWASWLFFTLTVSNLLPRSLSQHKWYLEHFPSYHKLNRKAFIPFIL